MLSQRYSISGNNAKSTKSSALPNKTPGSPAPAVYKPLNELGEAGYQWQKERLSLVDILKDRTLPVVVRVSLDRQTGRQAGK